MAWKRQGGKLKNLHKFVNVDDGEYCFRGDTLGKRGSSGGSAGQSVKDSQARLRLQSELGVNHPHRAEQTRPERGYTLND